MEPGARGALRRSSRVARRRVLFGALTAAAFVMTGALAGAASAGSAAAADAKLEPNTHFTMEADGSSGLKEGGEGIPNIDSVKRTIAAYYGDPGTGIANKVTSPYISEMHRILDDEHAWLARAYEKAIRNGNRPALVFDADDTTLWTYDMEVAAMKFVFDPVVQDRDWVQPQRFPATPGMVDFVNDAAAMGYTVFGLTGRNDNQKVATVGNLAKVGYTAFPSERFFTKWVSGSTPPAYIAPSWCTAYPSCNTVEYKAGTRKHIEQDLGYDIVLNVGDQWSDLQGGFADDTLKLPNPTYYLPSPDLPGVSEPRLAPETHFTMEPDGSSGLTVSGEKIPNIDVVKKTIAVYYGDTGNGISNKVTSPYIAEMDKLESQVRSMLLAKCTSGAARGTNPAVVLDADDTTLWTYDMEVAAMKFVFDPVVQDRDWVQPQRFPATPGMVALANDLAGAGCTLVGITGRNTTQRAATLGNLAKVGYTGLTDANYYTKWTSTEPIPSYVTCVIAPRCTTIEYKSQTRAHVEALGFDIIANFGDQFSDLAGGFADQAIKLPNPTYYLP